MVSYQAYMREYAASVYPDRYHSIMEEQEFLEDATSDKSKVFKENYLFRDQLQIPYVSETLKQKSVQDALIEFTGAFIDRNSNVLSKPGPILMFRFGEKETSFLYETFGITKQQLLDLFQSVIQDTYFGSISKFLETLVKNAPHKLLLVAILIDALQNQYTDIIECMEYLFPFCDYPMIFTHYWPTGVKEEVMEYTIEHLPNKFKIKKVSNLQGLLKWDGHSTVAHFSDKAIDGQDHWYVDIIYSLRSRMNNTMRNISDVYYRNSKEGATKHQSVDQFEDGSIAERDGFNTNLAQIIDSTVNKFASGSMNPSIVKLCAESSNVDQDNLTTFLNQIFSDRTNQLSRLIEAILTAYFNKYPTSTGIMASEFVPYGFAMYRSIGTSKDPIYQQIKTILDHWAYDILELQNLYKRDGTRIIYTRAIFNYIILMINYYN